VPNPYENALNNLSGAIRDFNEDERERSRAVYCPVCLTQLESFLNTGFVGCSDCYKTFYSYLRDFCLDVHGRYVHIGKVPSKETTKLAKKREIIKLEELEEQAALKKDYILAQEYKKRRQQLMEDLK